MTGPKQTLAAAVAIAVAAALTVATGTAATPAGRCGVERWAVKTLTDPAAGTVDLTPRAATVAQLDALPVPAGADQPTRAAGENRTYTVTATLTGYKLEADRDLHLVLADKGQTMIAEIPDPSCVAGSRVLGQIGQARRAFLADHPAAGCFACLAETVTLTGVVFFDRKHGQTGVAPNAVELHPVIAYSAGASRGKR